MLILLIIPPNRKEPNGEYISKLWHIYMMDYYTVKKNIKSAMILLIPHSRKLEEEKTK